MDQRLRDARKIADRLLSSEKIDFNGLTPSRLEDKLPVVYAITVSLLYFERFLH